MNPVSSTPELQQQAPGARLPRLAFVGVGWIGLNRLRAAQALADFRVGAIIDPAQSARQAAAQAVPDAAIHAEFTAALEDDIDGVVIATPSALHAEQTRQALEAGKAVFCQKPLARTWDETHQVLQAARQADRLLGVDLSYRHVRGVDQMRKQIADGQIGDVFAAELVFHNAYGPDKPWFYDARLSGGGCLIDLGTHLIDLAQWILPGQRVTQLTSQLFQQGRRLQASDVAAGAVEDFAQVTWETDRGTAVRVACSWNLSAGGDAVIEATFYGNRGALRLRNLDHSFFDFTVEHLQGTQCQTIAPGCGDWGGRALAAWVQQLAVAPQYDPQIESLVEVAEVLDRSYGRR